MLFPFVKNEEYKYQALAHLTFYSDREILAERFQLSLDHHHHHHHLHHRSNQEEDEDEQLTESP